MSPNCKGDHICHKCKQDGYSHEPDRCNRPLCCVNCGEEHSARSRDCKTWKITKQVLHVRFTQGIGFPEARRIANTKFMSPSSTTSYSAITKSNTNKSITYFDASTQTDSVPAKDIPSEKPKVPAKPSQTSQVQKAAANPTLPPAIQNVPKYSNNEDYVMANRNEETYGLKT
ncbi:uncharacterized protein LOC128555403 [Mercenaria mercenaria]|uniref:uncharacterized protein LOC128555403 n=1 Tax=Mercenaria mercenaria TaxID=6596 RepID=UPI00234F8C25|nr:uncharacterized protein LOC128555403 [Mercenaria mercenaria]